VIAVIRHWVEHRRSIRRRWQADARALVAADERDAYYQAQRLAARARLRDDRAGFYHWTKVAAEVARIAPQAETDIDVVRAIVAHEERRQA
jgi:hypothetical protein